MLSFDQSFFNFPYTKRNTHSVSEFENSESFISFTDGLRYLISLFAIQSSDYILLPRFYCPETFYELKKISRICFYEINNNLLPDKDSYFQAIETYSPKVIINYSFTEFSLDESEKKKLHSYSKSKKILIIEDFAHRILKKEDVIFSYPFHCYIDSTRKYFSLLESHVIANFSLRNKKNISRINGYVIKLMSLNFLKHICDYLYLSLSIPFMEQLSDTLFTAIDNLVGTCIKPNYAPYIYSYIYAHLDLNRYEKHIYYLMKQYQIIFFKHEKLFIIPQSVANVDYILPYFPVIIKPEIQKKLLPFLHERKIYCELLWEIDSCQELKKSQMLYECFIIFPLTGNVQEKDLKELENALQEYKQKYE